MKGVGVELIDSGAGVGRQEDEGPISETIVLCDSGCGLQALHRREYKGVWTFFSLALVIHSFIHTFIQQIVIEPL